MEWDAEDQPSDDTLGFLPVLGGLGDILGWEDGGQGWIRTSVRKPGQIYSLLPLTTRPPVLGARFGKRSNGETRLACQCQSWERRSEEHTSELQSLMRISYAVFCLKKKKHNQITTYTYIQDTELYIHIEQLNNI